jgi:hypothetical protein
MCKWKYNIKMKLKELEEKGLEWKYLTQHYVAVVNLVMNLRVTKNSGNFFTS